MLDSADQHQMVLSAQVLNFFLLNFFLLLLHAASVGAVQRTQTLMMW
jgi:hypothetical protein